MRLANAIATVETGRTFGIKGQSGEKGAMQFLDSTWKLHARTVLGYVPEFTEVNEKYVAVKYIETRLEAGLSPRQIAWEWNSGQHKSCWAGTNALGVAYDICAYGEAVMAHYK